ncbi:MAG TPA: hypothetical protein VGL70_07950 [Candidatus Binatia bacterium]|jgi:hypothetical protein
MAKIWLLQEGVPLQGNALAEKPLSWCVNELGLRRGYRLATPRETVIIGRTSASDLSPFGNRRYVVIELEDSETTAYAGDSWRNGYYLLLISMEGLVDKLSRASDKTMETH